MLYSDALERQFERAVAPLKVSTEPVTGLNHRRAIRPGDFALDVAQNGSVESFVLRLGPGAAERWEFHVVNIDRAQRHLLLVATSAQGDGEVPRHFLCGHDERHLFVAGVDARVPTVAAAMEALKPDVVLASQAKHNVRARARNRRRNPAFLRQGEWFFLPRPAFTPEQPALVRHNEPIRRGGGKAHVVEYLYRQAGERVCVCDRYPRGIGERAYQALLKSRPQAARWNWRLMTRTSQVYGCGRVRHPDHATIVLPTWHLVVVSREAGANVTFLD